MDDAETIGQTKKSSLPQNIRKPAKSIDLLTSYPAPPPFAALIANAGCLYKGLARQGLHELLSWPRTGVERRYGYNSKGWKRLIRGEISGTPNTNYHLYDRNYAHPVGHLLHRAGQPHQLRHLDSGGL